MCLRGRATDILLPGDSVPPLGPSLLLPIGTPGYQQLKRARKEPGSVQTPAILRHPVLTFSLPGSSSLPYGLVACRCNRGPVDMKLAA
jgi:hypothetical protein